MKASLKVIKEGKEIYKTANVISKVSVERQYSTEIEWEIIKKKNYEWLILYLIQRLYIN